MMQKIILVDTFGFLFRSFFALPPLRDKEGFPTGLLQGFGALLLKFQKEIGLQNVIFALEGGKNFRKTLYPKYKSTRQEIPQDLALQLPIVMEWIKRMKLTSVSIEGYEADDVIATLSNLAVKKGYEVEIYSHDKDLYQLINEGICLFDPIKKIPIKAEQCLEKYGVHPQQFIDFQSLVGDSVDNVPGIPSIGPKTAQKLIHHFGSLEEIYARTEELEGVVSKKIASKILEHKEEAYLSRKLVSLRKDVLEDFSFGSSLEGGSNPMLAIASDLEEYQLYKILQRLKKLPTTQGTPKKIRAKGIGGVDYSPQKKSEFHCIPHLITEERELFALLDSIPSDALIAYDCETNGLDALQARLVGFSFCFDGIHGYYVPISHDYLGVGKQVDTKDAKRAIEKIFSHPIVGHNLKFDLMIAKANFNLTPKREIQDSMLLAYLLDSASMMGLDILMEKFFGKKMIAYDEVVKKGKTFGDVDLERASEYASEDAVACFCLQERLKEELQAKRCAHLLELAKDLEYPFIEVLADMEYQGIKIDVEWFEALKESLSEALSQKEEEIFAHAKQNFNINSPKQLSRVLFDDLKLRGLRRVKGGYSTDEKTLEELKDSHPIIPILMEYREIFKLKNTYAEPILKLRTKENKIHTSFSQTGTTTGRLSSRSPNLQNIPVRTEAGKQIRRGFIADAGKKLISVDYSQIELRLLAHFSQDQELLDAFRKDLDIHLRTAQMVFGEDAKNKRHIAKTINFGLIYGMGTRKLSQTLKISNTEAKEYIDRYFASFPTVRQFLRTEEEQILRRGYAQTLLGHRRYFNFKGVGDFMRSNFLREGINAIFQGSAADLMKLSMNKIYQTFQNSGVKMLLQVHDELIFQSPEEEAEDAAREIENIMNGVYELRVPLRCNVAIGQNWADLK
ncbi:DNA polymerase I [Helicobacter mustelae]|uniref:DNA polymerase I n=1 Tax=Helicobacter mustelae (strain ATCC 43772 / CCUG 25715 / CIP 103759 / LMG 18044 / NCTC 12198 / R85-136P) TaxID=679897 RepID=D3UJG1_HELM1|nr:DNA polymerase I [Helicobacter mustelae]CBG40637.1 DNA polymerase I [Helicobacter mustelae 12198]